VASDETKRKKMKEGNVPKKTKQMTRRSVSEKRRRAREEEQTEAEAQQR
jgi:hypothetical protein